MAKKLYEQLIEEHKREIEQAKELYAQSKTLYAQGQEVFNSTEDEVDKYIESESYFNQAATLTYQADSIVSKMAQDVDNAYWNVPFAKAREQGKEKFWKLSGIK